MHSLMREEGNEKDLIERQGMDKATRNVLEECRMVLPGIQALFGFQLIAVFNKPFFEILSPAGQIAHLVALGMSAIAIALVMSPAAYHRQVHPQAVSHRHLRFSSLMLGIGMVPLTFAIGIDFYLIVHAVVHNAAIAGVATAVVGSFFGILWFLFPRVEKRRLAQQRRPPS